MSAKDKLQIVLITYNRERYLSETLSTLFSDASPVKDFDITILDNHSTDGTRALIEKHQSAHPNLKYICHNRNIGGNANIARPFEIATREYLWVICDDDEYDWSAWSDVENAIEESHNAICIADFNIPKDKRNDTAYLIHQMTFLPSIIVNTSLLTDEALRNIYDTAVFLFPHLAPIIMHVNQGGKIFLTPRPLVHFGRHQIDSSFIRGYSANSIFNRARTMSMIVGFVNATSNLNDATLARQCFNVAIFGNHQFRMGTYRFLSDIFLHLNGHKNDMHITDLTMQAPFLLKTEIRIVHFLSNTFLYSLLSDSFFYRILRRLYDKCKKDPEPDSLTR